MSEMAIFFLLGPSGCGKTTLLKIIGGLENPTRGTIKIMGEDVTHLPANKRNTSTVFQEWALFPHMNVFDNIAFGLRMQKKERLRLKKKWPNFWPSFNLKDTKTEWPSS